MTSYVSNDLRLTEAMIRRAEEVVRNYIGDDRRVTVTDLVESMLRVQCETVTEIADGMVKDGYRICPHVGTPGECPP